MSKIAYLGPVDPEDASRVYRLPGEPGKPETDVELPFNQEVDVTQSQLKRLRADEAHRFGAATELEGVTAPLDGYDELNADDVVKALGDPKRVPTAAVAQAILDYEAAHADRKTVTDAATAQVEAFTVAADDGNGDSGESR